MRRELGERPSSFFRCKDVVLKLLFGDEIRGCAVELSQEPHLTDKGLLSAFALATELPTAIICWRSDVMTGLPWRVDALLMCRQKDIVQGMTRQGKDKAWHHCRVSGLT